MWAGLKRKAPLCPQTAGGTEELRPLLEFWPGRKRLSGTLALRWPLAPGSGSGARGRLGAMAVASGGSSPGWMGPRKTYPGSCLRNGWAGKNMAPKRNQIQHQRCSWASAAPACGSCPAGRAGQFPLTHGQGGVTLLLSRAFARKETEKGRGEKPRAGEGVRVQSKRDQDQ